MKPYYQDDLVTLYNGDCREVLPGLDMVDAVITDPPYGVEFAQWDSSIPSGWLSLARVCAPVVVFTTTPTTLWDYPRPDVVLCWHRPAARSVTIFGGFNHWTPIPVYGRCDFAVDTITLHAMAHAQKGDIGHPTPKPTALISWLLRGLGCKSVVDPFSGSGSTLVGCKRTGVKAIGIEINEAYCEIAANRLRQGSLSAMFQP